MARIKIEIDTDKASLEGVETLTSPAIAPVSPKPMVLVSTITLTRDLKQDFEAGAGQRPLYKDGVDYDDLPTVLQTYDGANRLIITTGGLVAFNAARDTLTTAYFVSLVGAVPQGNQGRCLGGVTVSGWNANSARVDFLAAKGRSRAGIGLFCNPKSAMNQAEETNWATIQGVNQTILHGGGTGGRNNPNHYPAEIAHANTAGITTLVISADPFFFTREKNSSKPQMNGSREPQQVRATYATHFTNTGIRAGKINQLRVPPLGMVAVFQTLIARLVLLPHYN